MLDAARFERSSWGMKNTMKFSHTTGGAQMKKTVLVLTILATCAGTAYAADTADHPPKKGRATIQLPAKNGAVTFSHKEHQELLKGCKKCHATPKGKIDELGKDWAHKTCKGCHVDMKKGPVKCAECHKK